jgi:hypothetical protein
MKAEHPKYVKDALRGLTAVQRQFVIDGCIHGDVTITTVRALQDRALFYLHPDSPNGRCGSLRLTPLGLTVQSILKDRVAAQVKAAA